MRRFVMIKRTGESTMIEDTKEKQVAASEAGGGNLSKFRFYRNIAASVISFVLALVIALTNFNGADYLNNIFIKIMFIVLGTGAMYCAFAIASLALRLINGKQGFTPAKPKLNIFLDIAFYIALSVGGIFLFYFICQKIVWVGIALAVIGFVRAYADFKYAMDKF
jgi:hypothetical protein